VKYLLKITLYNLSSDGLGMWRAWEIREVCTGLWWVDLNERHHLEDLGIDERFIITLIFKKWDGEPLSGLSGPE
jgi:hypothetical protein